MVPPRHTGKGPSKAPAAAPAAAPGPPRLPSIDPPEAWEGRRLASQPSTTSEASEAPSLLALGAPRAAQALAVSSSAPAAAAAADPSAARPASGRAGVPAVHPPPRGQGRLQLQGAPSLVDAVVNMQPLPTSGAVGPAAASPALPASPPGGGASGAAGPAAAGPANGPAALEAEAFNDRPPLLPASSASSSVNGSTSPIEEGESLAAAAQEQRQRQQQQQWQGHAEQEQPGQADAGSGKEEAEEQEAEAEEGDDGTSFASATSGRYLTPGSSVGHYPASSSSGSDGSHSGSPERRPVGALPTWQPLQPTVEPPPRPGGGSGRNHAAPSSVASQGPQEAAGQPATERAELPPAFARLDSEGVHAPPPSPAGSAAPSASSSAAPSAAVYPAVTPKAASPTCRKRFGAAPAGAPSAPASPATPAAYAAAPPVPQWQPQAATAPVAAAQWPEAHQHDIVPQGSRQGAAGSWPGALPPWRQPTPSRPLQGTFVPHRRSRLAHEGGGGSAAPIQASGIEAAGHVPPPSAASVFAPGSEVVEPEQGAVSSTGSRAAPASGWGQQQAPEGQQQQQQQQQQAREADSTPSSSAGEPQLTVIQGEWPPLPAEPEAPGPWPATQASSAQQRQEPSLGWGGMRSAFQAAAQGQGQQSPVRSPAWRHLDDGSWHEPGGEVDWEAPSAFGASPAGTADAARTAFAAEGQVEALIHDSLVEAASHSPPLSPTTTRLLALHRPSGELRRGPQRAVSLGPGLSLPDRQPSMLSPEGQHLRLASQPSSPLMAASAVQRSLPPALASHPSHPDSWPGSPAAQRSTPELSLRPWGQQVEQLPSPASASGVQRSQNSSIAGGQGGGSSLLTGGIGAGGGMSFGAAQGTGTAQGAGSSLRPLATAEYQPARLPVLNASPDVAEAGAVAQPSPNSPFRAPSAGGPSCSQAVRLAGLGGLPLPPVAGLDAGTVDKRDSRRLHSADLSPREAYAEEDMRRPLLARSSRSFPAGSEGGDWEAGGGWAGGARVSNWWTIAALLASSALGIGQVAVPRALSLLGLVAGGVGLAVTLLLALLSHHCLAGAAAELADLSGRPLTSIADVASAALGPVWAVLADIALASNCFGLMAASLLVAGDILVGSGSQDGLLGSWGGDRATVLAVLCAVVVLPLLCFRDISYLTCSSRLSITTSAMWAAALLALTVAALSQGAACRMPVFPAWAQLHGGGRHGGGWFARTVELLGALPVLLVAPSCLVAAVGPVARQLRPYSASRMRGAASTALLYCAGLADLLAVCACLLFGRSVQSDVLLSITPEALAPLAGDPAGPAAFLLIRLAFLVAVVAGFPLLMGPFRDALWRVLFWQPLLQGLGLLVVTLLSLGGALWASLQVASLWQLLSVLGGTTGALLVLLIPGLVAACAARPGGGGATLQRSGGALLLLAGSVVVAATVLRLTFFPAPA